MPQMRLEASQRQELHFTLAMQQAVALLVMSTLELQQHIQQELETNPTLELVDQEDPGEVPAADEASEPPTVEAEAEAASEAQPAAAATEPEPAPGEPSEEAPVKDEIDYENLFSSPRSGEAPSGGGGEGGENPIEDTATEDILLSEHLLNQLSLAAPAAEVDAAARLIISKLDNDGFLGQGAESFAAANKADPSAVFQALELVKSFDPPGVGAIDAREALLIQLDLRGERDSVAWRIIAHHFEDLGRNRLPAIAKAMMTDLTEVTAAIEVIRTLEPRPGRAFGHADTTYIIPDVIVEKINGEYVVSLRNDRLPSIRISDYYLRLYEQEKRSKNEVSHYLKDKLDNAILLIKSIEKRQNTLYRVSEAIVKHQRDFFEYGAKYLKPMTLKDVAQDLDIHESTVSRVTTQKYMQTPQGTYELKYFFTSSIATASGEDASARSVKTILKELINGEDPQKPWSDQKLAEMLASRGFQIARRTVTKYREQLEIPAAQQRIKY